MNLPPDLCLVREKIMFFGVYPSESEIEFLRPYLISKTYKKGEIILKAGDICTEAYFIKKGLMRSFQMMPNGNQKTYIISRELNIFTEHVSFMSQTPSTDFIEAIEETEVVAFNYEDLMSLYTKYHVWETIGRKISDINFIISQKRLRSMMNDDAATRYKKFQHSYQNILHRIPQHIVASYLGITPQSLSRLKRELDGCSE
ncbi:CRP-like cAMP-binding protein [Arcicella aurantiaca]|uniref:CRP-like cAMP-binding protein n=1 Tax=Arcicella aurantiaca TaxID=591202 RepID=A0A316EUM6_9BACT|nr:Crp/Fnr family transcriptional regulator [Arcicella aurantiaca]PWK26938.1 CRP-like cAMP-binding protein [Arcicella aurantiaca]